jgi:hypothetical protein
MINRKEVLERLSDILWVLSSEYEGVDPEAEVHRISEGNVYAERYDRVIKQLKEVKGNG